MCFNDGTDVSVPNQAGPRSSIESDWFVDKATELGLTTFWLGVNDKNVDGEYYHSGAPQTYFKWAPNNPTGDDATKRACVQTGGVQGYDWDDTTCWSTNDVLCTHVTGKAVKVRLSDDQSHVTGRRRALIER